MSKNICFDVLDDTVDKYNKTYHNTIKMKPTDIRSTSYAEYNIDSNEKDSNFKLVIMKEYQNKEMFLLKGILLIGQKTLL